GRIDDRFVEFENRQRQPLGLRIEPHAYERVVVLPRRGEMGDESLHATRTREVMLRFLRWTRRIDTAAGVTPGMRPACPIVFGRISARRCRTSWERPLSEA